MNIDVGAAQMSRINMHFSWQARDLVGMAAHQGSSGLVPNANMKTRRLAAPRVVPLACAFL